MSKTIENLKSGNYEVVDNQGVSVTQHFIECLEKEFADLEAKLKESEKKFIVANNLRKNSDEVLLNYKTEKYGLDKTIQELRKMKLSLPEKECYYKGFENCERQMSSHIADLTLEVNELKQQLAESESELVLAKNTSINTNKMEILHLQIENEELKQQLAEKDKEKFKSMYFNKCLDFEHLHEEFVDKCNEFELKEYDYRQTIFEKDQDKISFCIEQLEKVKDWCKEYRTEDEFGVFTINVDDELTTEDNLLNFIDNQIEELKKEIN